MGRKAIRYPVSLPPLLAAVFLTGATALVYQIVWTRWLAHQLGSTTGALAAVLSSFMLGLALGAVVVGRTADRARRLLRRYGTLEIGIGFYALVFEDLVKLGHETLPAFPWLQAFLLLLVPTALMGATLPLLARAAAETHKQGTRVFGRLYAVNTMGAVAGALITTFYLLEHLGLRGSVQAAAFVNLAVGGVFWLLTL